MQLAARAAVVTGASRGIGAGVARSLAAEGARLVVAATRAERLLDVAREIEAAGGQAHAVACDVADPRSVAELAVLAREKLGHVDILVNNAGVAGSAPIGRIQLEDWNRAFAVNATGSLLCTQAFLGPMLERGWGRIVNVASVAARVGAPYIAAYTASKHALLGLTRCAAAELAGKGVTVNAVCPGYVDTDMADSAVRGVMQRSGLSREQALCAILETVGQPRLLSVGEVAAVVTFLCGDGAAGINGQAIVVDAGGVLV